MHSYALEYHVKCAECSAHNLQEHGSVYTGVAAIPKLICMQTCRRSLGDCTLGHPMHDKVLGIGAHLGNSSQ